MVMNRIVVPVYVGSSPTVLPKRLLVDGRLGNRGLIMF